MMKQQIFLLVSLQSKCFVFSPNPSNPLRHCRRCTDASRTVVLEAGQNTATSRPWLPAMRVPPHRHPTRSHSIPFLPFPKLNSNNSLHPVSPSSSQPNSTRRRPPKKITLARHDDTGSEDWREGGVIPSPAAAKHQRKAPHHGRVISFNNPPPPSLAIPPPPREPLSPRLLSPVHTSSSPSSSPPDLVLPAAAGRGARRDPVRASASASLVAACRHSGRLTYTARIAGGSLHLSTRSPRGLGHLQLAARSFQAPLPAWRFRSEARRGAGAGLVSTLALMAIGVARR